MDTRPVSLAFAPQAVWDAGVTLAHLAWNIGSWAADNRLALAFAGAVGWLGWEVLARHLAATALKHRTYVELVPSRQFEPREEEILRFGAQLLRAAAAGPWWTPRAARSVRVRMRADGRVPLA